MRIKRMENIHSVSAVYPPAPEGIPANFTNPSSQYKTKAWLAMLGLGAFCLIYCGLTIWFIYAAWAAWNMALVSGEIVVYAVSGAGLTFVALFLLKGLFFKKAGSGSKDFELTPETQPKLFEFLLKVINETGAPRPHKVYLSSSVNACVFYDLSFWNFLFPSKKNLEIGLGLVNALNVSEFKAVIAHEFGHFAQRSMAVGRWVYVAQRIAAQLVYHRGKMDGFLQGLSRVDIRLAWIGWLLRLVVWAIRSVLDTLLTLVSLAEKALSREMEFQADLVAVSVTGSDALVNGLHRLSPADQAWQDAVDFVEDQARDGKKVTNFFAIQSRVLESHREILNDEQHGMSPKLPEGIEARASHRVFTADMAQPPQMWSTHPENHLREENAKERYVAAELKEEPAWVLFNDAGDLRRAMTASMLDGLDKPEQNEDETMSDLALKYSKERYNSRYRGAYLGRTSVEGVKSIGELFHDDQKHGPLGTYDEIYPESLGDELEKNRQLFKEFNMLDALIDRRAETPDGKIRFRGKVIGRGELGNAIEVVKIDLAESSARLDAHDRRCRSHHRNIAYAVGEGWFEYHESLVKLLHFADHSLRNLMDANMKMNNTVAVVLADGNVSSKELDRVMNDALDFNYTLRSVYCKGVPSLDLSPVILKEMKVEDIQKEMGEYQLPGPTKENIGEWLEVAESYSHAGAAMLADLRSAALEELLLVEVMLARYYLEQVPLEPAPTRCQHTDDYKTLTEGEERELQTKLNWWDSFQTASGPVAEVIRFAVAGVLLIVALWMSIPVVKSYRDYSASTSEVRSFSR